MGRPRTTHQADTIARRWRCLGLFEQRFVAVAIADAAGRGRPKRSSAITRCWRRGASMVLAGRSLAYPVNRRESLIGVDRIGPARRGGVGPIFVVVRQAARTARLSIRSDSAQNLTHRVRFSRAARSARSLMARSRHGTRRRRQHSSRTKPSNSPWQSKSTSTTLLRPRSDAGVPDASRARQAPPMGRHRFLPASLRST
jgi:hypothetical protein